MNVFNNTLLIIGNTFQKELRSRSLIFLGLMSIAIIVLLNTLLNFLGEEVLTQFGTGQASGLALTGVSMMVGFWCYFLSTFLIVDTIRSDLEQSVLPLLLTLPMSRLSYLLGRAFGVWLIVAFFYIGINTIAYILFSMTTKSSFTPSGLFLYSLFNLCSYFALIVIGLIISLYQGKLLSLALSLISVSFISASNSYFFSNNIKELLNNFEIMKTMGGIFHFALPRIGTLGAMAKSFLFEGEIQYNYPLEMIHFGASVIFLTFIAFLLLRTKDF